MEKTLLNTSKRTRFQCSTETANSIDHSERVENLAPWSRLWTADEDRGDVPKQLEVELDSGLESMQIIAMAARASSGVWRGTIEASIVWSFAARQLMVQRR